MGQRWRQSATGCGNSIGLGERLMMPDRADPPRDVQAIAWRSNATMCTGARGNKAPPASLSYITDRWRAPSRCRAESVGITNPDEHDP